MNNADSILNALADPVVLLDGDLRPVVANTAFYETMKMAPDFMREKSLPEIIVEGESTESLKAALKSVATRKSDMEQLEIECAVAGADRKLLSLTARRVKIGGNPSEMVLVELQDITRQEEAEEKILALNTALQLHATQLELVNENLEAFTHTASHDLRAPLRFMDKIANLLLQDHRHELSDAAVVKIQMILNSTSEMGNLIEDLIAFSQARHHPIDKTSVGMLRLAHEALDELKFEMEGRNIAVTIDELPSCKGERALLKQVFLNLLENALKYSRRSVNTEIHVGFNQADGNTTYYVRDNGVGFDEKHADSIFLPFHRLHRNQGYEGSGLGLALAKRIVESHNGRIWSESSEGIGTTMYFTIEEKTGDQLPAKDRAHAS